MEIAVADACTCQSGTASPRWRTSRNNSGAGGVTTVEIVCDECGQIVPILAPKGPAKAMHIPWSRTVQVRKPPPPAEPVGTNFQKLVQSLGVDDVSGCNCPAIRAEMDRLGVDGCVANKVRLVKSIKANAKNLTMEQKVAAASRAVWSGLAFKVNPFDPIPGMFDEAVRLTRNGD